VDDDNMDWMEDRVSRVTEKDHTLMWAIFVWIMDQEEKKNLDEGDSARR
jgi:hypothetical protein